MLLHCASLLPKLKQNPASATVHLPSPRVILKDRGAWLSQTSTTDLKKEGKKEGKIEVSEGGTAEQQEKNRRKIFFLLKIIFKATQDEEKIIPAASKELHSGLNA